MASFPMQPWSCDAKFVEVTGKVVGDGVEAATYTPMGDQFGTLYHTIWLQWYSQKLGALCASRTLAE